MYSYLIRIQKKCFQYRKNTFIKNILNVNLQTFRILIILIDYDTPHMIIIKMNCIH